MMIPKKNFFRFIITILITLYSAISSFPLLAKEYGPLQSGDSLWEIAGKVSPNDSVSRYQTIMALQKLNPDAFRISCNINSLKTGVVLQVPSLTQVEALTADQAFDEYTRQNEAWKNRKKQEIVCPPITDTNTTSSAETTTTEVPVTAQPTDTTTTNPTSPVESTASTEATATTTPVTETTATDNNGNTATNIEEVVPENPEIQPVATIDETTDSSVPNFSFSTDFMSWTNIGILVAAGVVAAFLIGWLLHRHSSQKYVQKRVLLKNPFSDHLDEISLHVVDPSKERSRERLKVVVAVNSLDKPTTVHDKAEMSLKSKLTNARIYLAEGRITEVHALLNEVIAQGTPTQQQEAQQLLKITESMQELQQQVASNQPENKTSTDETA